LLQEEARFQALSFLRHRPLSVFMVAASRRGSPAMAAVVEVIGRLEALVGTEGDLGRRKVLEDCVKGLRGTL
jgi:hypothetical protein